MISRGIWVDQPDDPAERRARFERWLRREIEDQIREAEGRASLGEGVSSELVSLREQLASVQHVRPIPGDRQLITDELRLHPHYWRVYVRMSGHVHFSLRSAVDEVRDAAARGVELPFDKPSRELAREALLLSLLSYGLFVEASDRTVHHGLGPRILELVMSSRIFDD